MTKVEEVFQNYWLIHNESAISYLPLLISYLKTGQSDFMSEDFKARVAPYYMSQSASGFERADMSQSENLVAVIPVMGALTKWGYNGTQKLIERTMAAESDPNVSAILYYFETPGGMVTNNDLAALTIKSCSKPTIGFGSSLVASAGMWLFSACNYRILSSKLDRIGSVGTMATFTDMSQFLKEKLGINVYEIYASLSSDKNNEIRELIAGNQTLLVASLDFLNEAFHEAIRTNLNIPKDSEVFTGKIFFAEKGIELGLADEINSLEYAVKLAHGKGIANAIKSNFI